MKSTSTTIRRLACVAGLALAAPAGLVTGAAGGPVVNGSKAPSCNDVRAQDCMTAAEYRALMIRSEALNRRYGPGDSLGSNQEGETT